MFDYAPTFRDPNSERDQDQLQSAVGLLFESGAFAVAPSYTGSTDLNTSLDDTLNINAVICAICLRLDDVTDRIDSHQQRMSTCLKL